MANGEYLNQTASYMMYEYEIYTYFITSLVDVQFNP